VGLAVDKIFEEPDGGTPLTAEEALDLIPAHIAYRRELNEAEQENITRGQEWALGRRNRDLLSEKFIKSLHQHMLGDVWRWAGKFRTSQRNIGIDHWLIPVYLRQLLDDSKAWIEFGTYPADEIAVLFHHRLVLIHPFPNGNGRDEESLRDPGVARQHYIKALHAADIHDITLLLAFSRS
jgi:Fic-DOC domain mobile mystery protein B